MIKKLDSFLTKDLLMVAAVFLAIVFFVVNYGNRQDIVNSIIRIEPVFLAVNLVLIIAFFALSFKKICAQFKKISRRTWILLGIIFFAGLLLRAAVAPVTHRLYFDEDIYLDIGKQIAQDGRGCLCNYGTAKECYSCELMKWPNGYTFMLAAAYLLFGVSEATAFNFVIALSSISVVMIFFAAYLLSKKEVIGLFAALFLALTPLLIMWSTTVATEPVFVFFSIATMVMFLLSKEDKKIFLLSMLLLALTVQIKTEGIILLPIAAVLFLLEKNKNAKSIVPWFVFFLMITPYLIHIYHASKVDTWGSSGEKFGLSYMAKNVPENLVFWIAGHPTIEHPLLYTIFAVVGLIMFRERKVIFLTVWFAAIFLLYSSFYAGSVRYGVDVRYALLQYPPFLILAAYGVYNITQMKKVKRFELLAGLVLAAITIATFFIYLPSITTPSHKIQEAIQARVYHDFVVETIPSLNKSCYVLSHDPSIYLVAGQPSLQSWMGTDKNTMDSLWEKTDCIIFDKDFWCTVEPYKSAECVTVLNQYPASEKIAESNSTYGHYAFYLLKK